MHATSAPTIVQASSRRQAVTIATCTRAGCLLLVSCAIERARRSDQPLRSRQAERIAADAGVPHPFLLVPRGSGYLVKVKAAVCVVPSPRPNVRVLQDFA